MDFETQRPEFYEALGRTIQVLRTDQGLDRRDLADRAGISYSYLAAIENGKKPPSSKVLLTLAEALGLLSHELLASVESRLRRRQPPVHAALHRVAAGAPASRAHGDWFHAAPHEAAPPPSSPDWALGVAATSQSPSRASAVPYSAAGFFMEMERLNPRLSDADRELVLGLARRLAAGE